MELSTENIITALRKEYDEWIKLLTEEERHAIEKYSWNSFDVYNGKKSFFKRLNSMLRNETSDEKKMLEKYADIISNAILKHPIRQSVVCYRGSDYDMSGNTPVGESFVALQFISTSIIQSKKLNGRYEFIIYVPKGAHVAYIEKISKFKKQRELLIDKNTTFIVLSRSDFLIELEVLI